MGLDKLANGFLDGSLDPFLPNRNTIRPQASIEEIIRELHAGILTNPRKYVSRGPETPNIQFSNIAYLYANEELVADVCGDGTLCLSQRLAGSRLGGKSGPHLRRHAPK